MLAAGAQRREPMFALRVAIIAAVVVAAVLPGGGIIHRRSDPPGDRDHYGWRWYRNGRDQELIVLTAIRRSDGAE